MLGHTLAAFRNVATIADHTAKIATHAVGEEVAREVQVAADLAEKALRIAEGEVQDVPGTARDIARNAAGMATETLQDVAGGVAMGTVAIGRNALNIVEDATQIAEQAGEDATKRATNMARNAAHIAVNATTIVTATSSPAQRTAAKIVGNALSIADEAAGIASKAVGGTADSAVKIAGKAAEVAGEAAKVTGAAAEDAGGAAIAIARNAAIIAEEATKITGGAAGGALRITQGAASIAGEAARIVGGTVEGVVGGAVEDVAGSTVEVANHISSIAGHAESIAAGVVTDTLRAGRFKLSQGAGKLFSLCAEPNVVLETATAVFRNADPEVVRSSVLEITGCIFAAVAPDLGRAPAIYAQIMGNKETAATLQHIINNRSKVAQFFISLVEPAKLFVAASTPEGEEANGKEDENRYNELHLGKAMNRHAVISQLQRLAKSLVVILQDDQDQSGLANFVMDTQLETDGDDDMVGDNTAKSIAEEEEPWFFINGIAGELYWSSLACNKLKKRFSREVHSIFNRSEGILWDLIECAGQRDPRGGEGGLETKSSKEALENLKRKLKQALSSKGDEGKGSVVVVAHSQGCLLLRMVLEELVEEAKTDDTMWTKMKRLRVYTFGNPSTDWDVHKYVGHTEHFANKADYVAELGVLKNGKGYQCEDCSDEENKDHPQQLTFINHKWKGHLFGAQYSLNAGDYEPNDSPLLLDMDRDIMIVNSIPNG
ncbi:hypothetical protein MPH_09217 [Macrophomina phaseolina MS6]|uniref:Uncharacterized protein n=1 Tax=Macrophomina phaseolina (strain MS6) TaxID=1126212 RepID=K2S9R2_MACPH|nr:hypothetical protein MPH_09217 [Macrophomina phaseolina MS6]